MENNNTSGQTNEQQPVQPVQPPQPPAQPIVDATGGSETLPNSIAVLVLGIISIVGCFCYGIPGLVLGIIALVLAGKARKLYQENPDLYTQSSYKNMMGGRVCAIIGTCISGAYLLFLIIYIIFIGAALTTMFSTMPWDQFNSY